MRIFSVIPGPVAFNVGRGSAFAVPFVAALVLLGGCSSVIILKPNDEGSGGAGGSTSTSTSTSTSGVGGQGVGGSGGGPPPDLCGTFDLAVGMVAHYPFDGDTKDVTGHGHDGIPSGSFPFVAGKHGKAISISGMDERITVLDAPSLDTNEEFSVAVWVNPTTLNTGPQNYPAILSKGWVVGQGGDYLLNVQIGDAEGLAAFSVADFESGGPPPDGVASPGDAMVPRKIPVDEWTQVTATFKLGLIRLFVGGTLVAEKQSKVTHTSPSPYLDDELVIGNVISNAFHNYGWQGAIDDLRIYGRALDDDEIACIGTQP